MSQKNPPGAGTHLELVKLVKLVKLGEHELWHSCKTGVIRTLRGRLLRRVLDLRSIRVFWIRRGRLFGFRLLLRSPGAHDVGRAWREIQRSVGVDIVMCLPLLLNNDDAP